MKRLCYADVRVLAALGSLYSSGVEPPYTLDQVKVKYLEVGCG